MIATQWHSQPATRQDEWVVKKLGGKTGGTFIEIGANDGRRHSNTLTLEESFGWRGLLVEADPQLYIECERNREAYCVNAAIGPSDEGRENFAIGGSGGYGGSNAYSGLTRFMSPKWLEGHAFHKSKIVQVNTLSLRTLLDTQWMAGENTIDYLSLDVEGAELAILKSFMAYPGKFKFRCLTVEFLYDRDTLRSLESVLGAEYVLDEVRAFDACFVHKDLI